MTYEEALEKIAPNGAKITDYLIARQAAELYAKHHAMEFLDDIRDYEKEARVMIGFYVKYVVSLAGTYTMKKVLFINHAAAKRVNAVVIALSYDSRDRKPNQSACD